MRSTHDAPTTFRTLKKSVDPIILKLAASRPEFMAILVNEFEHPSPDRGAAGERVRPVQTARSGG